MHRTVSINLRAKVGRNIDCLWSEEEGMTGASTVSMSYGRLVIGDTEFGWEFVNPLWDLTLQNCSHEGEILIQSNWMVSGSRGSLYIDQVSLRSIEFPL